MVFIQETVDKFIEFYYNYNMRKKNKLVCGVGVNDFDGRVLIDGKKIASYEIWTCMIKRCYSPKVKQRQPTYTDCLVCDEWLCFSTFKQWFDENYMNGLHLDKDIITQGNNIYSAINCRFVPQYINSLLTDSGNARGDLPMGVSAQKPNITNGRINATYFARCRNGEGKQLTKTFKTVEEASAWYSVTKTRVVREVAKKALDAGDIKQDVFDALVSRKF
jgi:hypothetical protein